jgi:prepilin-type N-terminal cleavage/methylation domain-containing protein
VRIKRHRAKLEWARGSSRAFTFVELVVVIVILAVVAGMVIPRLTSWKSREGELAVNIVADLLTAAAKRDTYSTQRSAIEFDASTGRFRLLALRVRDVQSFDPGGEEWVEDPLSPAAKLEGANLMSATAGIAELDPKRFQIEFPGAGSAQGRPGLALVFADTAGQQWTVRLPSTATRAEVTPGVSRAGSTTGDSYAVDLDATGRRDDPW